MNKQLYLLIPLFILGLVSCNSEEKKTKEDLQAEQLDSLYQSVMDIHDEVMPRIKEIENQQRLLRADMQNMEEGPRKDSILTLLTELKKGYDDMFDWMHELKSNQINPEFYSKKHQKVMNYLKEEEKKIKAVAEQMNKSITAVDKFLAK